jgi:hypothetical protein
MNGVPLDEPPELAIAGDDEGDEPGDVTDGAWAVFDGVLPGDAVDDDGAAAVLDGEEPGDVVDVDGAAAVLDGEDPGDAVEDDGAAALLEDDPIAGQGEPLACKTCPGRQPAGAGALVDGDGDAEGDADGDAASGDALWANAGAENRAAQAAASKMRFIGECLRC